MADAIRVAFKPAISYERNTPSFLYIYPHVYRINKKLRNPQNNIFMKQSLRFARQQIFIQYDILRFVLLSIKLFDNLLGICNNANICKVKDGGIFISIDSDDFSGIFYTGDMLNCT